MAGDFFTTLAANDYLAAYGCGGGWYQGASGVGSTADWAANDPKTVFTLLFGSYFGDWDVGDSFLRAPLASPSYTLTSAWSGRPQWYLQGMAIGETVGHGARLTQTNSSYFPFNYGNNWVHVALMGDPTLRMHPVLGPSFLSTNVVGNAVGILWGIGQSDVGFHLYRANGANGTNWVRLTTVPTRNARWIDSGLASGTYRYMAKAIHMETSAGGTYINSSQGAFGTAVIP